MSRRGQSRAAGAIAASAEMEEAHNTLEVPDADFDPVMGAIRFGMDSIMKIVNDTVPYCPADNEQLKRDVADRMENSLLQLVEAELTYSQTSAIVNQVVEELALQDNPDMDAREFAESVDSINDLANQRIAEYKATLTEDILGSHPRYLQMKSQLNALLSRMDINDADMADAETEAEEVDLDDSTAVDDDDSHEAIPDLDPITKQPLEDPVRNKICRHIYGKESMLQFIKKNPKTRCPAMGCDNANFVKASHLVEDPVLTARVTGQPIPPKLSRASPRASTSKAKRGRRRR